MIIIRTIIIIRRRTRRRTINNTICLKLTLCTTHIIELRRASCTVGARIAWAFLAWMPFWCHGWITEVAISGNKLESLLQNLRHARLTEFHKICTINAGSTYEWQCSAKLCLFPRYFSFHLATFLAQPYAYIQDYSQDVTSQDDHTVWLVGWSLTALSAQKGYIVPCRN